MMKVVQKLKLEMIISSLGPPPPALVPYPSDDEVPHWKISKVHALWHKRQTTLKGRNYVQKYVFGIGGHDALKAMEHAVDHLKAEYDLAKEEEEENNDMSDGEDDDQSMPESSNATGITAPANLTGRARKRWVYSTSLGNLWAVLGTDSTLQRRKRVCARLRRRRALRKSVLRQRQNSKRTRALRMKSYVK